MSEEGTFEYEHQGGEPVAFPRPISDRQPNELELAAFQALQTDPFMRAEAPESPEGCTVFRSIRATDALGVETVFTVRILADKLGYAGLSLAGLAPKQIARPTGYNVDNDSISIASTDGLPRICRSEDRALVELQDPLLAIRGLAALILDSRAS